MIKDVTMETNTPEVGNWSNQKVKVRKSWKMKRAAEVWLSSRKMWVGGRRPAEFEPGEASYNPTGSNVQKNSRNL